MSNIFGKLTRFTGSDPRKVESELSPSDLDTKIPEPTETEVSLVSFVNSRFQSAADNRKSHESTWFLSLAYYGGNQFVEWRDNKLVPAFGMSDPHRVFTQRNKIRPKIKKLLSTALSSKPIANIAPTTNSDIDRAAASEARAIVAHQDSLQDRQSQTKRIARYALTTSTAFLKITWDSTADADVPKLDKDGKVSGSTRADVGEIKEDVVPCFDIYIDPKAHSFTEANWLIHAKVRSLDYVQQRYPRGNFVVPDISSGPEGYVDSRVAAVVGDYRRGSEPGKKNSVLVKELWEKPTARYPKGRLITVAGSVVLRNDAWPYDKKDEFPFIPVSYEEAQDTVYGLNAVSDLIPAQKSYNESISRLMERQKTAWGKILTPRGSEIGEGAFNSARENEIIYHNPGSVPQYIPAPTTPPIHREMLAIEEGNLNDISGVHEVSEGSAPPGVTAGNAIEMLKQSDTTQMADFTESLESYIKKVAEWEIALAAQYYNEPRLIAVSSASAVKPLPFAAPPVPQNTQEAPDPNQPTGNMPPQAPDTGAQDPSGAQVPQSPPTGAQGQPGAKEGQPPSTPGEENSKLFEAAYQVQNFRALTKGGSCRVSVLAGSATPKSPAAQSENILNYFKAGLFGPPQAPETAAIALKLLDLTRSDEVIEWMMAAKKQIMDDIKAQTPAAPDPSVLAAQQHAAQVASDQFKAQQAAQANQDKVQALQAVEQVKQQAAQNLLQQQQAFEAHMAEQKAQFDLQKQREMIAHQQSHVAVSLAGKLGPTSVQSAEKEAGLEPDTQAEAAQAAAPVPAKPSEA